MVGELQIFRNEEFEKLRELEKERSEYMGFFYLMEYGDALKIGSTQRPRQRLSRLKKQCEDYAGLTSGKIAISPQHTNYRENENYIHRMFSKFRRNRTELFDIGIDSAIKDIEKSSIEYEDNSAEFAAKADKVLDMMKKSILKNIISVRDEDKTEIKYREDMSDSEIVAEALIIANKLLGTSNQNPSEQQKTCVCKGGLDIGKDEPYSKTR